MNKYDAQFLKQRQALPLWTKIEMTKNRIEQWYQRNKGNVFVSFSGGKDSVVLLDLVRSIYPEVPAVFFNTGLEFPEIVKFVKTFENVEIIRPKKTFKEVIEKYGYPVISKDVADKIEVFRNTKSEKVRHTKQFGRKGDINPNFIIGKIPDKWFYLTQAPFKISAKCCYHLKKSVNCKYVKETKSLPFIGTLAEDSRLRQSAYLKNGCNVWGKHSNPIMFWRRKDIWQYIRDNNIPYCDIYDKGYSSTGCVFCAFGAHMEKEPNRFQLLKQTHPKLWKYCMDELGMREVLDYIKVKYE